MKNIGRIILNKTLFIILTIVVLLFSNFAPIISWAVENSGTTEEIEDEYVTFDLTWSDGTTEITNNAGTIGAKFTVQFNTMESFKNFRIEVERTEKVNVKYENIGQYFGNSSSASQIQYLEDVPGGTRIEGNIEFEFLEDNHFQMYQKNLVVKLIGTYELDGEEINVELTRNIIANIITPPKTDYHELTLNVKSKETGVTKITSSNTSELYVVERVIYTFYIEYYQKNSEYQKFEFNIYRTASNNNTYYPDSVYFSDGNFDMTKVDNGDGTYKYVATRGTEHEEYEYGNLLLQDNRVTQASIQVVYDIENAREDLSTDSNIYISLISKGYDVTKSEAEETSEKTTLQETGIISENTGLYRNTPGHDTWGNSYISACGEYPTKAMQQFLQKDKLKVTYSTDFWYENGRNSPGSTTITQDKRRLEYFEYSTSEYKSQYCTQDSMYVKRIEVEDMMVGEDTWIKFYKQGSSIPFFTATADNLVYIAPENEKIGDFYAELNDIQLYKYGGWDTTYELCASSLKDEGMSEEDITNIKAIAVEQNANGASIFAQQTIAKYYIIDRYIQEISEFSIGMSQANLNVSSSEQLGELDGEISFHLDKGEIYDSIISGTYEDYYREFTRLKCTNPKFYVELPNEFEFKIEDIGIYNMYTGINSSLEIKNYKIKKYNSKKVLEIEIEGKSNKEDVYIKYKRKLKHSCTNKNGQLKVYMITEEGKYSTSAIDINDYNQNGDTTDKIGYCKESYTIGYNSQIQIQNNVYSASNDLKVNEDIKLESGNTVKYATTVVNDDNTIKNINIISRLPFAGNKTILGNNLIELGSTISLENLKNIEVYEERDENEIKIDANTYEIGYSSEETADFDTTFDTSDSAITTAKTLQIKMSDSYKLYKGNKLIVKYELDIPEGVTDGEIAAQMSAVKYVDKDDAVQTIEGIKSRVIVGSSAGTVEIVKKFEGENNQESLENIQFKITNMDDDTKYYTETTDANGHVIFTNIPVGDYEITELTEFEKYKAKSAQYITISNGEEYTIENGNSISFENIMKKTKIEIIKTWKDTDEIQLHEIKFEIQGTAVNGEEKTIETRTYTENDEERNKVQRAIAYVPYGSYTIKETKGKYGWYADEVNIEANQELLNVNIENKITKGNIEIIKTAPENETVEGLTFKITGIGDVSYLNKEGDKVLFEEDIEVIIDETNENIQISEDKRTANIIIPNMPVGTYKITEINMPKLNTESGEVTKYVNVVKTVTVPDINGETVSVPIENKHKTGNIDVNIIIDEGADIEDFKDIEIKVSGTSYYGNNFEQKMTIPTSGKLTFANLEIGKYKVEECNTKNINGKIYTTDPDGFEVTYEPEDANSSGVEIQWGKTTNVNINHEYTGKGVVKIQKSLEGEIDASKAKGIAFTVTGKDLIGNDVNEKITIGEDGTGTSNPIPVGTYLLSEVESTVPDIYQIAEEQEITITTKNTEENPLMLQIENKLAEGKIIMETETVEGGYPPTPVKYEVTKLDDNLNPLEEAIEVQGDSKSKAELTNLKGGKYLVRQQIVPTGYKKDDDQIVKVTRDSMGYALFLIDKPEIEEFDNTTIKIQKDLVNEAGETAVIEDFVKAKLDIKESYSFEIRLRNAETNQIYYSFVENNKTDTIQDLPYGTYEVEEIYKPKYKMLEITGDDITKDQTTGKYKFTLSQSKKQISLTIKNQIDTNFGFGGQDSKDNLSKILAEEVEQIKVTKARIYVRDEQDNKISDADFKLYDDQGNVLKLVGNSGEYTISEEGSEIITPVNGLIVLKALPIGNYKVVNERVDSTLLPSDDKIVTVYENAVGIIRIELLKNIPRGSLRLSTTYTNDKGETKYVPKSKYKILNPTTEEVLTFIRKVDGTYYRNNTPNATDTITLKAGYVDVMGIEAGEEYKVGVVDLTAKYGVIKEEPEKVTIIEAESQEVNVSVQERGNKFKKLLNYDNYKKLNGAYHQEPFIALDSEGKLYSKMSTIEPIEYDRLDLKGIKDYILTSYCSGDGVGDHVWMFLNEKGRLYYYQEDVDMYFRYFDDNNIKIQKIINQKSALDENGKIWSWTITQKLEVVDGWGWYRQHVYFGQPHCVSMENGLNDVILIDANDSLAIDIDGKLWSWNQTSSTCISDIENNRLRDVKIKKAVGTWPELGFAIDTENRLWTWGDNALNLRREEMNEEYSNPICLNDSTVLPEKGIIDIETSYKTVLAIDEDGNLITWGKNGYGLLGTGESYSSSEYNGNEYVLEPNWITLDEKLENVYFCSSKLAGAIDINGNIWLWGKASEMPCKYELYTSYDNLSMKPTSIKKSISSYFYIPEFTKLEGSTSVSLAIDENERLWSWGRSSSSYYGLLGNGTTNSITKTPVLVGGDYSEISKTKIIDISANDFTALALDNEEKVWAWGGGSYFGAKGNISEPLCLTNLRGHILQDKKINKIAAGGRKNMFIDDEGKLYVLGLNESKNINAEYEECSDINFVDIKGVAEEGFIALDSNGNVWSMSPDNSTPQQINFNGIKIKSVVGSKFCDSSSYIHYLAIDEEGDLWTWGNNNYGQLGIPNTELTNSTEPLCLTSRETILDKKNILYGKKIVNALASDCMSMVLDDTGKLYTWGQNTYGQLGQNISNTNAVQGIECINTSNGLEVKDIAIGNKYCLAIDRNKDVWTWGYNSNGTTGRNENYTNLPLKLRGTTYKYQEMYNEKYEHISDAVTVYCSTEYNESSEESNEIDNTTQKKQCYVYDYDTEEGGYAYIELDGEGNLWTYGQNNYCGILGDGTTNSRNEPRCINDMLDNKKIDEILYFNTCYTNAIANAVVRDTEGNLWSWGDNCYGQCGTIATSVVLTPISPNKEHGISVNKVIASGVTNIVQDAEGKIWSWGDNIDGQCGTDTEYAVFPPKCINEGNRFEVDQVIKSGRTNIVQDTEGRIWTWGYNYYGQCGTGNTERVITPTCITDEISMDLRESNVLITDSGVLAINKYNEAYIWNQNAKPTKINNIGKLKGKKVKELATTPNGLIALTTEGDLFIIAEDLQSVSGAGDVIIIGTYGIGPWKKEFMLLQDSEY